MKRLFLTLAAAAAILASPAIESAKAGAVRIGLLSCRVEGGEGFLVASKKFMRCTFYRPHGRRHHYRGVIRKYGIDVGHTETTVIKWAVFSLSTDRHRHRLAGNYVGVSGEASFVAGVGANALAGGWKRSLVLQPISVQGQLGYNFAATVSRLTLRPL